MELANVLKLGKMGFKPEDIKKIKASGIESDDIVELAKNGYSASDVDELIALTQEQAEILQPGNEAKSLPEPEPGNDGAKEADYNKEEIQKANDEIEALKAQVARLQDRNAQKNLGTESVDPRQAVKEIFRSIY